MKLVLWDKAEKCKFSDHKILYWNDSSFLEKPLSELNTNLENDSINNYLEHHSEDIRNDFLDWVNKLSSVKINNKKFKDLIKLENDFSYWNLCEFNELSNFSKSKNFEKVIKLLALKKYLFENKISEIDIFSDDISLKGSLARLHDKNLKVKLNDSFIRNLFIRFKQILNFNKLRTIPLFWIFIFYFRNLKLINKNLTKTFKPSTKSLTFVSYFNNYDKKKLIDHNFFESSYWGKLPTFLRKQYQNTNWIHISLQNEAKKINSHGLTTLEAIRNINKDRNNFQQHLFVESLFTWRIGFKALLRFYKVCLLSLIYQRLISKKWDFFPIINFEFVKTFQSHNTLENILYFYLFKDLPKILPLQERIIYLHENHPWEKSLCYFSKMSDHKKLLAHVHTNVRFWDLRYTYLENNIQEEGHSITPDIYCVNGMNQKKSLINNQYPPEKLKHVEALRFEFLNEDHKANLIKSSSREIHYNKYILVLGCYLESNSELLLELTDELNQVLPKNVSILFKPHPALTIQSTSKKQNVKFIDMSMSDALALSDIVITSSVTTGSLDAYLMKKTVYVYQTSSALNMSPMREIDDDVFFNNKRKLIEMIKSDIKEDKVYNSQKISLEDFYFFNSQYSLWNKELGLE